MPTLLPRVGAFDKQHFPRKLAKLPSARDTSQPQSMSSPTPIHAKNVQIIENGTGITIVNGASATLADLRARAVPYLRTLAAKCRRLPLRGLDSKANDPTAEGIHLDSVYVALDTKHQRSGKVNARGKRGDESAELEPGGIIPALAAVIENSRVVLLGDPGSGKTTFLSHLAYCLAEHHAAPAENTLARLPGWSAESMPVLIVLRRFVAWVQSQKQQPQPGTQPVWDFFKAQLTPDSCTDCAAALESAAEVNGGVLFIFDGLDEVPTDELRTYVRDCAAAFTTRYPGAAMILTCRTIPYRRPEWQLAKVPAFELAPFHSEQIDAFITGWFTAHRDFCAMDPAQASRKQATLIAALHDSKRAEMRKLAGNPMLLTVMALLQTKDRELPEKRAELYREVVELLLARWDATRSDDGTAVRSVSDLMREKGRDMNDLHDVLRAVAWEAQSVCTGADNADAVADIPRESLHRAFISLTTPPDFGWADSVVETIQERSGLLLATQEHVFQFPHRSFQEFIASGTLLVEENFPDNIPPLVELSGYWREVIKWAVGRATHCDNRINDAVSMIETLVPANAQPCDVHWQKVWLAGECLLEMGRAKAEKTKKGRELAERVVARLVALVEAGALPPHDRAAAGMVLGRLGDPRKGVGCKDGVPEFAWSPVFQKCDYVLGEGNEKRHIFEDYQMSVYPVTVAQFAAFIDDGYRNDEFWTPEGRKWRAKYSEPVESDWAELQTPNHPRVSVSWYEAMAFCKWASKRLEQSIRLPTEAEWERAAAGPKEGGRPAPLRREASPRKSQDAGNHSVVQGAETAPLLGATREYAWGSAEKADLATHCNCDRTAIDQTSAVGIFPTGKTPEGIFDMTGNVYEWCASRYYGNTKDASLPVADLENEGGVRRGGSWGDYTPDCLRASYRAVDHPGNHHVFYGFRVLLVAAAR